MGDGQLELSWNRFERGLERGDRLFARHPLDGTSGILTQRCSSWRNAATAQTLAAPEFRNHPEDIRRTLAGRPAREAQQLLDDRRPGSPRRLARRPCERSATFRGGSRAISNSASAAKIAKGISAGGPIEPALCKRRSAPADRRFESSQAAGQVVNGSISPILQIENRCLVLYRARSASRRLGETGLQVIGMPLGPAHQASGLLSPTISHLLSSTGAGGRAGTRLAKNAEIRHAGPVLDIHDALLAGADAGEPVLHVAGTLVDVHGARQAAASGEPCAPPTSRRRRPSACRPFSPW